MNRTFDFSTLTSSDISYIDGLYSDYKKDSNSVEDSWKQFFQGFEFGLKSSGSSSTTSSGGSDADLEKEFRAWSIVQSYRTRGHLLSTTNPIRQRVDRKPHLKLSDYGLTDADLEREFYIGVNLGIGKAKLKNIIAHMQKVYCSNIGVEYMHSNDTEIRRWFREKFEQGKGVYDLPIEQKKRILSKLNDAVIFENFLHTKYVGQKRFSLEGGENTIPALDAIINKAADHGVQEVLIGMAHRGRLNVLANVLGKTYEYIFNEFEGTAIPDLTMGDGDVKYHMGYSSEVQTANNKKVYLKLMPNPSHLEAVNPVVTGFARGQAHQLYNDNYSSVLPILIHGDAAVAGQGIVYETLQMSQLKGYFVGGTIHFVINNQIGFTTDFYDARSSNYSTSVARTLEIPVLHVNGDDAEAVIFAVELATEFRMKFQKDIFIDMVCYRRHGHNEGDEPRYTQPHLYGLISKHANPKDVYTQKLIEGKKIEAQLAEKMQEEFKNLLQDRLNLIKQKPLPYYYQAPELDWKNLKKATLKDFEKSPVTGVDKKVLDKIAKALTGLPEGFKPIAKTVKILQDREKAYSSDTLDWAMGELLAYGSLLIEGYGVRISGQDVIRGTFSHRHAEVFDENTNATYCGLNHIQGSQEKLRIHNSLLSEYAVLGFEYGYSLVSPNGINIWEAQFGDFANGAQTIIDQFISSAESKWQRMSGMLVNLPHGYEGQGPEHSNGRPERFLQLAAELNMIIVNCTSPANLFHMLRRQVKWDFRKPVINFTPKSLLRHPECVSKISDLTTGGFQEIIDDASADAKKIQKVLFCTGKVYFDLKAKQIAEKRTDVAIVRVEQLYPLAMNQVQAVFDKYKKAKKVWVQEEPLNMGAWNYLLRYQEFRDFEVVGRKASASPATGYASVHKKELEEILTKSFAN